MSSASRTRTAISAAQCAGPPARAANASTPGRSATPSARGILLLFGGSCLALTPLVACSPDCDETATCSPHMAAGSGNGGTAGESGGHGGTLQGGSSGESAAGSGGASGSTVGGRGSTSSGAGGTDGAGTGGEAGNGGGEGD